jgi:hypothetical protein
MIRQHALEVKKQTALNRNLSQIFIRIMLRNVRYAVTRWKHGAFASSTNRFKSANRAYCSEVERMEDWVSKAKQQSLSNSTHFVSKRRLLALFWALAFNSEKIKKLRL